MPDITARTIVDNEPIRLTGWHDDAYHGTGAPSMEAK